MPHFPCNAIVRQSVTVVTLIASFGCMALVGQTGVAQTAASTLNDLSQRKSMLEQQLEQIKASPGGANDPRLRNLQEQLLQVTGEEDAAMEQLPDSVKAASTTTFLTVPVYYVTDRMRTGDGFGGELRQDGVEFGKAKTTLGVTYGVRTDLIVGAKNLRQNSSVRPPTLQALPNITALLDEISLNKTDALGRKRRVVLFVHGYNVSFVDAVNASARLSTVLQFPVIPVVYSWPSSGTLVGYWHDEDMVRASAVRFMTFLRTFITKSPVEVAIVCHSMGVREVTAALAEIGRGGAKLPMLTKVVFAAGDMSSQEFSEAWPSLQKIHGVQFGFYASDHDLALRLSHIVHWLPRLGDTSPTLLAPAGGMTIDASVIDSVFQAVGHSYILNSPRIGADVATWIDTGATPEARGLVRVSRQGQTYFVFP